MQSNVYAVIMAGGIGSRFWPVSTSEYPKQFHDMLGSGQSLLQKTFSRLNTNIPEKNIWILTNARYNSLVMEQLPSITESQIVPEPAMRNTAPCILLSALKIYKENPEAVMIVAPSDHWIEDERAFHDDLQACIKACYESRGLLTLGIQPTFPNTGYGYIEADPSEASEIRKVKRFTEKPDYKTAKKFIERGNFMWNSGIFIWSVKAIIEAFEAHLPKMYKLFASGMDAYNTSDEAGFVLSNYPDAENISIDYGILEKADNVYVKKSTFDWNDLGTWGALHDKLSKDDRDNAVVNAKLHLENSEGNMIFTNTDKLVVLQDVSNYIIVENDEVLLIFPKSKEQTIKELSRNISQTFGAK